jgi:hypothetical protein
MALVVIKAQARFIGTDIGSPDAPSYDAITAAFREARLSGNEADRGDWIGPGPRVTRTGTDAVIAREQTVTAAWIYGWPTIGPWRTALPVGGIADELVRNVGERLNGSLPFVRLTWTVSSAPYDAEVNGPIDRWSSGAISLTQTRQQPQDGVAESPWGPPPSAITPRPPTAPATTQPAPTSMSTGAKVAVVGGIAVAATAAYLATRKKSKRA